MALSLGSLLFLALSLAVVLAAAAWAVQRYALVTVTRRIAQVLRLNWPAVGVGALVLVAGSAVLARYGSTAAPVPTGLAALLFLAGAAGLAIAVANLDWYRATRSLSVSTPDAIEAGPIQLEGTVAATEGSVESSVTQTPSVAYQAATLEERALFGRGLEGSVWSPTSTAFDATPFGLAAPEAGDDADASTVAVTVDASNATFPLLTPQSRVLSYTPARRATAGLDRTVSAEPGTAVPLNDDLGRGERPRPRRYAERRIDPDDDVYVLGTAAPSGEGYRIVDDPDGPPLIVARCTAAEASAHAHRLVVSYGLLALASLAAGLATVWFWL